MMKKVCIVFSFSQIDRCQLSENVRLTKKQILFLQEWTEENDPDKASEIFLGWMISERVDPVDIGFLIDKIIQRIQKGKK